MSDANAAMTQSHPLDDSIQKLNTRLKAARLGLAIERRGETLSLRGTLPPRPGSHRLKPYQQRLPLKLPANKVGLKQIEQEAKIVAARLIEKTFDWRDYLVTGGRLNSGSMDWEGQIRAFQQHFFAQYDTDDKSTASAKTTWEKAYAPYFKKLALVLEQSPSLNPAEAILATVQQTRANSRSRQVCCTALATLAGFLQLELPYDLKTYWGRYGNSKTKGRDLPSDEMIVQYYESIPNPAWQFVYGIMATYGLRNHEVFFCDFSQLMAGSNDARITVSETTKTGLHDVWPFYPEWVERFQLRHPRLPQIQTDLKQTTPQRIGQLVSNQFRRYQIPFSPYNLRHAWAVRTIHFGLPDTVAARMMGHSVAIHTQTYHRWISLRDQQQAVQTALAQNRITAPP